MNLLLQTNKKILARAIIKQIINKRLSFNANLLNKAKIPLTKKQIKKLLQDIRKESLPNEMCFLEIYLL